MKIKVKEATYESVLNMPGFSHARPERPNMFFRTLLKAVSYPDLKATRFKCRKIGMEQLGKNEPCLILMNHSSFIDLKIASSVLYPRPFNIVCTYDGFIGKNGLMRKLGCIPTRKFTSDVTLVRNMVFALRELKSSVLMYPEASYTFDGTETPLPASLGTCLKILQVPVIMIRTEGAFSRDPLYNNLQLRKVNVSATMEYILSPKDIKEKSTEELNQILAKQFSYDHFRWQRENNVRITEQFRADCLNRVLYKCPACNAEGRMKGKGTAISCGCCGKSYQLTEFGSIEAETGVTEFDHIPDWYRWERECVREELEKGSYQLECPVDICMMVNTDCLYRVGDGVLTHDPEGFRLIGCNGKLVYNQKPRSSYSLYSDFFWYELGDMICIGDEKAQYYCFPKMKEDIVAKTRLATEELYKIVK